MWKTNVTKCNFSLQVVNIVSDGYYAEAFYGRFVLW